ncbi:MAG: ComF family protein [Clostridia bacterium]|nr:ComF family protein [Clostridia bacterium]
MGILAKAMQNFRKKAIENSCICDICGAEVFSYPKPRLCPECLSRLTYNDRFFCDKCGRPTRGEGVCNTCKDIRPTFEKGTSALAYFDFSAATVNRFKNGKRYLSFFFAEELAKVLPRLPQKNYTLIAVPLNKEKKRIRGYNQSAELVECLSSLTGFKNRVDLLEKRKQVDQKQLSVKERRKNVVGAYRVVDKKYCKGKDFLVVDDVMTSGATLSEIASVLLKAGANSVYVASVSSVPDRDLVSQTNRLASI